MVAEREGRCLVSVVMAVYNGAERLQATIESVLDQAGCDLELVVVDDGSTDGTLALLQAYAARDSRVRAFTQPNTGLTGALILGCSHATGQFIARQDADDLSLQGRLAEQAAFLAANPEVAVVAGGVRFVAPKGEWLFDELPPKKIEIALDIEQIRTPSLVAAMFRRDAYLSCGGFHPAFVVAQDVDLWLRLEETGACRGLSKVYYQASMTMAGISSRRRSEQIEMAALAIACAKLRRAGGSDAQLLEDFSPTTYAHVPLSPSERARFNYFIASCLRKHDRSSAKGYYREAIRDNPFHLKALLRCIAG